MTKQQAEQFINIYNALLKISTKGEDTKVMAQILSAMENLADTIQVVEDAPAQPTVQAEGE